MFLTTLALAMAAIGQGPSDWNEPFPAHRVVGNVYYVGSKDLATFLITTPEGHILINSGFERTVPLIQRSIESLGFKITDVKILLASHAHSDHVAGHALLQKQTGAKVYVMRGDDEVIASGGKGQYLYTTDRWEPCRVDRVLEDRDEVKLGGVTMVARLTPGHTRGCTTWSWRAQDGGKQYDIIVGGSWAQPAYDAAGNTLQMPLPNSPGDAGTAAFDAWNRLMSVHANGSLAQGNRYDGNNRRVSISASGALRHCYFSAGWRDIEERLGSATNADRQFVWGLRYADDLVLRDRISERLFALQGPNCNVAALVDSSGSVKERYGYAAYAQPTFLSSAFTAQPASMYAWEILFGGYRYDSQVGAFLARNRYLLPNLGRWATCVVVGMGSRRRGSGVPATRHPPADVSYVYVDDRPTRLLAPEGGEGREPVPWPSANAKDILVSYYQQFCRTATAGYAHACNEQSNAAEMVLGTSPFACCAWGVSSVVCAYLNLEGGSHDIRLFDIPIDACFLGCLNECMYKHWKAKDTAEWGTAENVCQVEGHCSRSCCRASVNAEQSGQNDCSPGCGQKCGIPKEKLPGEKLAARIAFGETWCCLV